MRFFALLVEGLAHALLMLSTLLLGYDVAVLFKAQVPLVFAVLIGGGLSIILMFFWVKLLPETPLRSLAVKSRKDFLIAYLISFVWLPILFVPGLYLLTGEVTGLTNIIALWWFNFPVGLLMEMLPASFLYPKVEGPVRKPGKK